ncbi:MAG TPA: hypothetical protein VNF04_12230 [Stellaceae bacterium]|nr:hypothetical protein [Stellaceae bacterium]
MRRMVDLKRTPEEKAEVVIESMPTPASVNDYPYGLCISLDEDSLEKIDIDDGDVEIGDMLHGFFMAEVTAVRKEQIDGKASCRVELQITHLGVEDEDDEPAEAAA